MSTPIIDSLEKYINSHPTAFHMPGHKMGEGFIHDAFKNLARYDLTEFEGTDNLHFPEGCISEAQELAARAFGAKETFFLVNGSTGGIHAALLSVLEKGDKIIVSRDCHKSVIGGLMLSGAEAIYVNPVYQREQQILLGSDVDALILALDKEPSAKAVFITRPNYYGSCCDIDKLALAVHRRNKILIVDEAHGAHFNFHPKFPKSALTSGADIVIQSAHKTLPALTQGAYIHVGSSNVDVEKLKFFLRTLQTSSPSYLIMSSLDMAREIMSEKGMELIENLYSNIKEFKEEVDKLGIFKVFANPSQNNGYENDFSRIVINTSNTGNTGYRVEKILRDSYNIQVEMADYYNIVCISTIADKKVNFDNLYNGLKGIKLHFKVEIDFVDIYSDMVEIPPIGCKLNSALFCKSEKLLLAQSAGRFSSDIITPYPPGVPVLCPGEIIMDKTIEYLYNIIDAGGKVNGIDNDLNIRVLT